MCERRWPPPARWVPTIIARNSMRPRITRRPATGSRANPTTCCRADPGGRSSTTTCSMSSKSQIDISNQNVKAAAAAFEQSRALVSQARAGFWPTDCRESRHATRTASPRHGDQCRRRTDQHDRARIITYTAGVSANWDIDIWGRIRRTTESNRGFRAGQFRRAGGGPAIRPGRTRDRLFRAARTGSIGKAAGRHGRRRDTVAEDHREPI